MHSGRFLAVFLVENWFSRTEPRSDLILTSMVEFIISKKIFLFKVVMELKGLRVRNYSFPT